MKSSTKAMISLPQSIRFCLTVAVVMFGLQACATPYYGYSKADWDNLGEAQRATIRQAYQVVVDSRQDQAHRDLIDSHSDWIIYRGARGPTRGPVKLIE